MQRLRVLYGGWFNSNMFLETSRTVLPDDDRARLRGRLVQVVPDVQGVEAETRVGTMCDVERDPATQREAETPNEVSNQGGGTDETGREKVQDEVRGHVSVHDREQRRR